MYPDRFFMHFDLMPENWIAAHNKRHYWVIYRNGHNASFDDWAAAEEYVRARKMTGELLGY
jgi:hypothetical protein